MRHFLIACAGLLALLGLGCSATTDEAAYAPGDAGKLSITNHSEMPVYLSGCEHFVQQKRVDGRFEDQPPRILCIWEGLAVPVPAHEQLTLPFTAGDPGQWRMRVALGIGCDPTRPMNETHCRYVTNLYSNEFRVRNPGPIVEDGCVVSGCNGEICSEEPMASICIMLPWAHCFDSATCGQLGPSPIGRCGWEPTPELMRCLRDNGWRSTAGASLP